MQAKEYARSKCRWKKTAFCYKFLVQESSVPALSLECLTITQNQLKLDRFLHGSNKDGIMDKE